MELRRQSIINVSVMDLRLARLAHETHRLLKGCNARPFRGYRLDQPAVDGKAAARLLHSKKEPAGSRRYEIPMELGGVLIYLELEFRVEKNWVAIEWAPILPRGYVMDQERRQAPRFPFIASAEVLEEKAGSKLAARISDISATGCYVDTINPLVDGTAVRVKILNDSQVFEASATVVYSVAHLGMGLKFGEVLPNSLDVLQNWLPQEDGKFIAAQ